MGNEVYDAGSSVGQLIAAAIAHHKGEAFKHKELGKLLGYESTPPSAPSVPTPSPISGMSLGPNIPVSSPVTDANGIMTAPTPPMRPGVPYGTAPENMRPILGRSIGDISKIASALGPQATTDIFQGLGIGRQSPAQTDAMQLTMQPDGTFAITPGTKSVSARNANIILRQKDIANKRDLSAWRDAAEKRLAKGQLSREESIAMRADSDLLGLLISPQYDLMDDTTKSQLQSQATAAINRMQQRGVTVYTGGRKAASTPAAATPAPAKTPKATATPEMRYNQIKASNPNLTDQQIYSQMAIEEASQ